MYSFLKAAFNELLMRYFLPQYFSIFGSCSVGEANTKTVFFLILHLCDKGCIVLGEKTRYLQL